MSYTKRQQLFASYMLNQIGIFDKEDISTYLGYLSFLYGRLEPFPDDRYISGFNWKYTVSDCIDHLIEEIKLKKNYTNIKAKEPKQTNSATGYAYYQYCPASYVISNSFEIEKPSGVEFTNQGKLFHEQLRLARKSIGRKSEDSTISNTA